MSEARNVTATFARKTLQPISLVASTGLESTKGASSPTLASFANGRVLVGYRRGVDGGAEKSDTWHMVLDGNGIVVQPRQTDPAMDALNLNPHNRGPTSAAILAGGTSAVMAFANSSHNSLGGRAAVIRSDGVVDRSIGGSGAYQSQVCAVGADAVVSSLYVDPVSHAANYFSGASTNQGQVNFGGYGYNYYARQDLTCGDNASLGKYAIVGNGGPSQSQPHWRLRYYKIDDGTSWTQIGSAIQVNTAEEAYPAARSTWPMGIAVGGTRGVSLYRDVDTDGRSQIFLLRFTLNPTTGMQLLNSTAAKVTLDESSYEGLNAAVVYSGSGDDFLIALYSAGVSAAGQPANTQQAVSLHRLNHVTGQLTLIADPQVIGNWVATNNLADWLTWGGYFISKAGYGGAVDIALNCDGNLYVAASTRENSERGTLRVFKYPITDSNTCSAGASSVAQPAPTTSLTVPPSLGIARLDIGNGISGTSNLGGLGTVTTGLGAASSITSTTDPLTGSQYRLMRQPGGASGARDWWIDYLDSGSSALGRKELPSTTDVIWRGSKNSAIAMPSGGWLAVCESNVVSVQDGYQLLVGGRDRTLQNGWQSEIIVKGGAEAVLVTGVSCSGASAVVSGYAFGVSADEPPLRDEPVAATSFKLKLDPTGRESARKSEARPISVGEICALPRSQELEGFCRAAEAALQ
jgi:hypothetical protein